MLAGGDGTPSDPSVFSVRREPRLEEKVGKESSETQSGLHRPAVCTTWGLVRCVESRTHLHPQIPRRFTGKLEFEKPCSERVGKSN